MKKVFLILSVVIFNACGDSKPEKSTTVETTEVAKDYIEVESWEFMNQMRSDVAVFKSKYFGKKIKLKNLVLNRSYTVDSDRRLDLYAYTTNGDSISECTSRTWKDIHRYFINDKELNACDLHKKPKILNVTVKISSPENATNLKSSTADANSDGNSALGDYHYLYNIVDVVGTLSNLSNGVSVEIIEGSVENVQSFEKKKRNYIAPQKLANSNYGFIENNTTDVDKNATVEKPNTSPSEITGLWTGSFGKDQLTINIETIGNDGNVKGYDEVKGNKRNLTGTKTGNSFTLNEPGDDKWDGVFTFNFDKNTSKLKGEWKSNNGKSKKNFELTRK